MVPDYVSDCSSSDDNDLGASPRSILVVEDNPHHLTIIAGILGAAGHHVSVALSGSSAIKMIKARVYDLLVLDMVMPDVGGLTVLQAMRAAGPNICTPVIACTADHVRTAHQLAGEYGVIDIIAKPIDPERLLLLVGCVDPESDLAAAGVVAV